MTTQPYAAPTTPHMARHINQRRDSLYQLAAYYAWTARRATVPVGMDPRTGRPWSPWDTLARSIARAEATAAARATYAEARRYGPTPLP